jgi:energy-coupling factor transport system substrate-specific component
VSWVLATYLLLALTLLAGFVWYERQKPSSRMLAAVATLAGLAALGRIAFAPLPDVKPTTAIVVLGGYVLGGAPGFAIGSTAAVASNVFFGQGPWTPWQMLGWGLAGVIGALLARAAGRDLGRLPLALACALAALAFGLLLDFSTWITFTGDLTWRRFLVIEAASLPFNVTHVVASAGFCLAFGPALVRSLRRFRARLDVRWLPLAGATLLLVLASSAVASQTSGPARYLASAQNQDGGFAASPRGSSSQLYTAWAVIGLGAANADAAGRARAAHYMLANLSSLQDTGDYERTILALAAAPAQIPAQLLAQLTRAQQRDGSFGEQANLTAFGVLALRAAGRARSDAAVQRAAKWLAQQENADGGFGFGTRGGPSDVDDTGGALEALAAGGGPTAPAAAFLVSAQGSDGGFPSAAGGSSDAQSTAWAIQGLLAARRDGAQRRRADAYLAKLTAADGSVAYAQGNRQTPVWVTAQALAALAGKALPVIAVKPPVHHATVVAAPPPARIAPAPKAPAPLPSATGVLGALTSFLASATLVFHAL